MSSAETPAAFQKPASKHHMSILYCRQISLLDPQLRIIFFKLSRRWWSIAAWVWDDSHLKNKQLLRRKFGNLASDYILKKNWWPLIAALLIYTLAQCHRPNPSRRLAGETTRAGPTPGPDRLRGGRLRQQNEHTRQRKQKNENLKWTHVVWGRDRPKPPPSRVEGAAAPSPHKETKKNANNTMWNALHPRLPHTVFLDGMQGVFFRRHLDHQNSQLQHWTSFKVRTVVEPLVAKTSPPSSSQNMISFRRQ